MQSACRLWTRLVWQKSRASWRGSESKSVQEGSFLLNHSLTKLLFAKLSSSASLLVHQANQCRHGLSSANCTTICCKIRLNSSDSKVSNTWLVQHSDVYNLPLQTVLNPQSSAQWYRLKNITIYATLSILWRLLWYRIRSRWQGCALPIVMDKLMTFQRLKMSQIMHMVRYARMMSYSKMVNLSSGSLSRWAMKFRGRSALQFYVSEHFRN